MPDSFVHLHVHSEYSMLDGAAKVGKLLAEAERQGMPAGAMSDHGNMFGAYEMYTKAKDSSVKPILGIEAYVAPASRFGRKQVFWGNRSGQGSSSDGEGGKDVSGGGRYTHMTMWAENSQGLRNLFKLSTRASYEGYYGKPRMDRELIAENASGIIATTGCPSGEVQTRLRLGQYDEAVAAASAYQDIFGKSNYFLELMEHGLDIERDVREDLLRLAKQLNIPLLATNDSHYVTENQSDAHDSLLCIGTGKNKDEPNRLRFHGSGYYIKTSDQMRELFRELPEACDNTLLIAERVQSYDEVFAPVDRMPVFPVPEGETPASYLRKKVDEGLLHRFGEHPSQEVLDRVKYELTILGPLGYDSYFLVVADITAHARRNDIAVGPGRGSAAGSMVAYLLGITDIDPLPYGLLFERFLNPERVSPPDVDLDFDDRYRDQMVRYVAEKYGEEFTAQVNTFGMIKAKAAIKDSSRILGYPFAMGEKITKAMPPDVLGKSMPLSGVLDDKHPRYNEAAELREMYGTDPDVKKVIDTALGVEGLMRGTGVHACAVILSKDPLIDLIPLHRRDKDGVIITGFDYPSCESMGLIKMDFLGLRNLGIIDDALRIIEQNRGISLDIDKIPMDDQVTFAMLGRGETLGLFQLDGGGMQTLLKLMKPNHFNDISAASALYRPGPMGMDSHTNYALRKNGMQPITPIHPELAEPLEQVLGETYGLVVYQEQVQRAAQVLAGYSLGKADLLRRAMGKKKKEILDKEFVPFQAGCRERGYSDEAIQAVWDVLVPFAGYAFNKSHSAAYGMVSYRTAYLKANYPAEYMAALLTSVGDNKDKAALYLGECRKLGIRVLSPDVNESVLNFNAVGNDVRFGLGGIRNVGENVVASIIRSREAKGRYESFPDFMNKVEIAVCNKRAIESLIKAGAFDTLDHARRALVEVHERAVDAVLDVKKQESIGQDSLFGMFEEEAGSPTSASVGFEVPGTPEWAQKVKLSFEREMLGLYVSSHPLDGAEPLLARNRDTTIAQLLSGERTEGEVRISGIISKVDRRINKNSGAAWAIVTVEDLDAAVEVLFFPKVYPLYQNELIDDACISVRGRLNERDGAISIFGQELTPLDLSAIGQAMPLQLTLNARHVTQKSVAELGRILAAHPGPRPVRLTLQEPHNKVLFDLPGHPIEYSTELVSEIKTLFGPNCVAV